MSDLARKIAYMPAPHHPWRRLRDRLPEWEVVIRPLPTGVLGATDVARRLIFLDSRQKQAQRRCTLDHELHHAEAGDCGEQHAGRECTIDQASARRLIPIEKLVDACLWAHCVEELADECWVDVATMRCRVDNLEPAEAEAIRLAIAERDFHEEGMT